MKLRQLRYIHEITRHGLNVSTVAEVLHTAQPGISTQVRMLEDELGVRIFERNGKRLVGITEPGRIILQVAENILREVESIKQVGSEFADEQQGSLTIATTHTQARYALPAVVKDFMARFPTVKLNIQQGNPAQCAEDVAQGDADFAIATEALNQRKELVVLPCYSWNRCVVTPPDHPLLDEIPLTLEALARYPIITYDFAYTGRSLINKAFADKGLTPNVVLTAIDSDVIKTYVELGLGVGLLAQMAYDPLRDINLRSVDASALFSDSVTSVGIRRGKYLRGYMYAFLQMFATHLVRDTVDGAMRRENDEKNQ